MEEKKYGLILNPSKAKGSEAVRNLFAAAPEPSRQGRQNAIPKIEVQKSLAHVVKALEEDQDIFDYDKFKDNDEDEKLERITCLPVLLLRQPKYMEQMKRRAALRKQEMDIYFERTLKKEREKEDDQFGDKGVFLTSAYKKKLIEDQKWLESQKHQDEKDAREDARQRKGMGEFYKNYISGTNVSVGQLDASIQGEDVSRVTAEDLKAIDLDRERREREQRNVFIPLRDPNQRPAPQATRSSSASTASSPGSSRSSSRHRSHRSHHSSSRHHRDKKKSEHNRPSRSPRH